jgi:hypothetical protein
MKPLIQARFAEWAPLLALQPADLNYSSDGLSSLPPSTREYGQAMLAYVRALALASAAAHDTGVWSCVRAAA